MDDFTFKLNKIAGAVLGTCLVGMGIGIVAQEIYFPKPPKKPGYALPDEKEGGEAGAKKGPSLPALLAKADPKKGEADAKICSGCHSLEEGGGTKIGPVLYGVVEREKGSVQGFDYSAGLKKKGGKWTFADLNEFLTKPSAYIQGTKMGYQGEESPEKRAEIIAYLRTLSKKPVELPKVSEEDKKVAEGGGKKEGDKKEGGGDSFVKLVAAADPKKGESDAGVCSGCHSLKKGGGNMVGPELYGVVEREKGSFKGYDYSAGLKKKGGKWTYDDLNQFLTKPAAYIQGTKMGYQGEANEKKRAAIVAYLRTLAESPAPLPKAGEGDKKAEGGGDKKAEGGDKKAEGAGGGDIVKEIAAADAKKGESAAQICSSCHSLKKGGGNMVGPELWGVVDRDKGSFKGFDYSEGLKKKGGKWTYADLNQFLTKPSAYVQGTKMGYQGEPNEKKRALIIAYLRTLSDSPAPLPGAGGDKKAGGDQKKEEPAKKADSDKPAAADKKDEKKPEPASERKAEAEKPAPAADKDQKKPEPAPEKKAEAEKPAPAADKDQKKPEPAPEKKAEAEKPAPAADKDQKKSEPAPEKAADAGKPAAGDKPAEGGEGGGDIAKQIAAADPKKGESAAQICSACHSLKKGGGNMVGPELYGVVERDKGTFKGFDYSDGMKKKGGKWTYADLNQFLNKPSAYVQGTKMGYQGEPNEQKRFEIIAYLRTLSESPAPLPGGDKK